MSIETIKLSELTRFAGLSLPGNTRVMIYDPGEGKDRALLYGELMAGKWQDLTYDANHTYAIGEFAKAGDSYYEALTSTQGVAPPQAFDWEQVHLAIPFRPWAAGLHIADQVYVIGVLPSGLKYAWYRLTVSTPFKTLDFNTERDSGTWVLAQDTSGSGGGGAGAGYESPEELRDALSSLLNTSRLGTNSIKEDTGRSFLTDVNQNKLGHITVTGPVDLDNISGAASPVVTSPISHVSIGSVSLDLDTLDFVEITVDAEITTFTLTNGTVRNIPYIVRMVQGSTGGVLTAVGAGIRTMGDVDVLLSNAPAQVDVLKIWVEDDDTYLIEPIYGS